MKRGILTILVLSMAISVFAQKATKTIKKLDLYYAEALKEWNVPGMAIAIVKDGEIIFEKGYGVKSINAKAPVDQHSLFAVASNTKALTSASLAILVDEGKINWDDKVQHYLPEFQLSDPYVSANMTIRDLLCHRSGLATFSGDLIWYGSDHSREEVIRRARFLEPKYGFREHYGYQNIMFLAAGQLIPAVTGQEWEVFVRERILTPIGMDRTLVSTTELRKGDNIAYPHNDKNDGHVEIEYVNWDNIAPAGGLISSVHDWSQWLKLQLNTGKIDTTQIWSPERTNDMWQVHTPQSIANWTKDLFPSNTFKGYGLGWELSNIHGKKVVAHGGGYDGMISRTVMVPEENLGIVILTNSISYISYALAYETLDRMLGHKVQNDWSTKFKELVTRNPEPEAKPIPDTKPSLALLDYAGTYDCDVYGKCEVRVIGDQLAFQFAHTSIFRGTLRHWHYDTFQLNWGTQMMLPSGTVQFVLGPDGKVKEMQIDVPNPDFDFTELEFKKLD